MLLPHFTVIEVVLWILGVIIFKVAQFPVNKYRNHPSFWTPSNLCCSQFEFWSVKLFWKYSPCWMSLRTSQTTGNIHTQGKPWALTGTCSAVSRWWGKVPVPASELNHMKKFEWYISSLLTFPGLLKSYRLPLVAIKTRARAKAERACQAREQKDVWVWACAGG